VQRTVRPLPPLFEAVIGPVQGFFRLESAGGILLLAATAVALGWANSPWGESYERLVHLPVQIGAPDAAISFSLHALVNEGLMTFFFFAVGMEIKRELTIGELRSWDRALLPAVAAVGGMIAPAGIYMAFTAGTDALRGWAIPIATDIAFAIGLVSAVRGRVPWALVVFLTALAIFDDVGGIAVIAAFYGHGVNLAWLLASAVIGLTAAALGRRHVHPGWAYAALGALLWYAMHRSGIHPSLSGVALGLAIPARSLVSSTAVLGELRRYLDGLADKPEDEEVTTEEILRIEDRLEDLEPPLNRFLHGLHGWVSFVVVPLFALANAGVDMRAMSLSDLISPVPLGVGLGLFVGKQIGILACTLAAVRLGWSPMPGGTSLRQLWGVSTVAGIGFTVALFVAALAFEDDARLLTHAKLGILTGSFLSAVVGFVILRTPFIAGRKAASPR
jgi:NhaA family Na+:H+ antiporter